MTRCPGLRGCSFPPFALRFIRLMQAPSMAPLVRFDGSRGEQEQAPTRSRLVACPYCTYVTAPHGRAWIIQLSSASSRLVSVVVVLRVDVL